MNRRQMLNSTLLTPIAVVTATGRVAIADAAVVSARFFVGVQHTKADSDHIET